MRKSILIIDDSISVRNIIRKTLELTGFDLAEAVDGVDALEKLKEKKFNLILCDINMPRMDGIQFLKAIQALPEHSGIPVIMLTTESSETFKRAGKEAGAKAWIVKPFKPDQLLMGVAKLIR